MYMNQEPKAGLLSLIILMNDKSTLHHGRLQLEIGRKLVNKICQRYLYERRYESNVSNTFLSNPALQKAARVTD
jgi:hypothetical protein